jgi:peptidoglycan/LPS O-acetylase OafA/YrhL
MSRPHTVHQTARTVGEDGQPPSERKSAIPQITDGISANPIFKPRSLTPLTSAHLDLIRGLAAWVVMWEHSRALFVVNYDQVQTPDIALKLLYFLTGFGHQAVIVFFVLSGFLISSSIFGKWDSGKWSWHEYGIDRLSRLWVVLVPGLALGFFWDKLGSQLFSATGLYSTPLKNFGSVVVRDHLGLGTLLGNLFFLQTIHFPELGSNGPLWSLANEFWYYILFPFGLFAWIARKRGALVTSCLCAVSFIAVALFVGRPITTSFSIWLMGTVLVFAYAKYRSQRKSSAILFVLAAAIALCGLLAFERNGHLNDFRGDLLMGAVFTIFLFGVLQLDFGARNPFYERLAQGLAGFSYSLYVLHFPLLLFLRARIAPTGKWQPDAVHLGYWSILGAAVLAYSWFISMFTERRTKAVRNWMRRLLPAFEARAQEI